ncbi:transposable element Tcb1 transposase [Trichonephila clavipes]|nr:transposable element Tcb1 transposase [Trichonephila clavipes]
MPPKRSAIGRSTKQAKRRREERASETSEQRKTRQERDQVHTETADLHIFKWGSVTAIRYRDEVLKSIVRLCAAAVGPTFVLMDNNARPHRADIVDDYLKRRDCAYGVSSRFPPPATLIKLEIALQEEWRLLNSAVAYHLVESMVRR